MKLAQAAVLLVLSLLFVSAASARGGDFCGTLEALRAFRTGGKLVRPPLGQDTVSSRHFVIHYDTTGQHATTRAYAESVSVFAEYSWRVQIDSLGWIAPPPDDTAGGDARYDIYIVQSGYPGLTTAESEYPDPYPLGHTSYTQIKRNMTPWNYVRATVAHEFNHASQNRYRLAQEGDEWWVEGTASWMSDVCYDDANQYLDYLDEDFNPLAQPELAINHTGPTGADSNYCYAGAIWPMFLHEYYSIDCPRRCWERFGGNPEAVMTSIDWVLSNTYLSSLSEALAKYAVWRYFTGPARSDVLYHFSESDLWPESYVLRTHDTYPTSGDQGLRAPSGPGGANFIEFTSGSEMLSAAFDGQDDAQWTAYLADYRYPQQSTEREIELDTSQCGTGKIAWQDDGRLALIPVMTQWNPPAPGVTHHYSGSLSSRMEWQQATPQAGYSKRSYHASVVFGDRMWVFGGYDNTDQYKNDVWYSSDGVNWTRATANAGWSVRTDLASVVFDGRMWVIGGWAGDTNKNDVWYSTDGMNWTLATANAGWSGRTEHASVVFDGKMWVIGGVAVGNPPTYYNDVWCSTDGVNWTRATANAGWSARGDHTSAVFDGKIWVMGGYGGSGNLYSDVWYSPNGATWTRATADAGWLRRMGHASVTFDNRLWVIGGRNFGETWSDVWYSSDGQTWTQATANAAWTGRHDHTSVVFDDEMWVIGGSFDTNDVWYSRSLVPQPRIWANPASFSLTLRQNQAKDTTLRLFNNGDVDLAWSLVESPPVEWLAATPMSGVVSPRPNNRMDVTLSFDTTGLSPGVYYTNLVIASNDPDNDTVTVSVELRILPPRLTVDPTLLSLLVAPNELKDTTLSIANSGGAELTWTLSVLPQVAWLSEDSLGGVIEPGEELDVPVHFNAIVVNPGTYRCTLEITSNDPDNPVVKVPVEMTVEDVRGTVCGYVYKACGDAGSDVCLPPVESAYVEVLDSVTGVERVLGSGHTDDSGFYSIPALGLGTYLIRVRKPGYVDYTTERGHLACPGQTTPAEPVEFVDVAVQPPGRWPRGTPLGSFMGVTAYSNHGTPEIHGLYGNPYECVEYMRRFYRQALFYPLPDGYHAGNYFPHATILGLDSFANSTSAPPRAGDIICWSGGLHGHVAIAETVVNKPPNDEFNDTVYIIQQNTQDNDSSCRWPLPAMIRSNGTCSLSTRFMEPPPGYVTQGWLRRRNLPAGPFANMVFVDDNWSNASGSAFSYFGNPSLWHQWSKGRDWPHFPIGASRNRMLYVAGRTTAPVNYAIWRPNLPSSGRYEVFAFIPSQHGTTRHARYFINASTYCDDTVINQSVYSAQYVSLGTYDFYKGISGYVWLTDSTGETDRQVGFDALLFVKRSGGLMDVSGSQAQPIVVEPGEFRLEVQTVARPAGRVPIRYSIPREGNVNLAVYDATGRRAAVLAEGRKRPGFYESAWDSRGHASGVYFCTLDNGAQRISRKLVLTE